MHPSKLEATVRNLTGKPNESIWRPSYKSQTPVPKGSFLTGKSSTRHC